MADIDFQIDVVGPSIQTFLGRLVEIFSAEANDIAVALTDAGARNIQDQIDAKLTKDPSGKTRESVTKTKVRTGRGQVDLEVGPTVEWGAIQNFGKSEHRASQVSKLAVPLSFAQVPRGLAPRDWPGKLTVIPRGSGKDSLLAVVGKDRFEPKYVLKTKVRIPATGYLDAATDQTEADAEIIVLEGILRIFEKAASSVGVQS